MKISNRILEYIKEFGETTTLHGVSWLVSNKIHWTEVLVWSIAFTLSASGSVLLIYNSGYRYYINPTVISLQKDYRSWNLPFPAATVCFTDKLNLTRAKDFIKKNWYDTDEDKNNYYLEFLSKIANSKYGMLNEFTKYKNDKQFKSLNLIHISEQINVKMSFHATIFNPKYKNINFIETISELGLCYTFSGVMSQYLAIQQEDSRYNFTPPYCNFLNSLCYARIEDLPTNISYYVHSTHEVPDIRAKHFTVETMMERDTTFRFLETVASKELKNLTPDQRKCRFNDEPLKDWSIPRYSYNICLMECRRMLAYKLCGCSPHFYKKQDGIPVCNVEGLACLASHTTALLSLKYKGESVKCQCYPTCEFINLYVDKDNSREWTYPIPCNIRFRWAIESYSKTRLRRDILYGIEDLLVSFGGTAALFLGCSLLTFIEIVYFFGLRLFWYIYLSKKSVTPSSKSKKLNVFYPSLHSRTCYKTTMRNRRLRLNYM